MLQFVTVVAMFNKSEELCAHHYIFKRRESARVKSFARIIRSPRGIFLLKKIVENDVTPSTQCHLFPVLICFFLISEEIPFHKPI